MLNLCPLTAPSWMEVGVTGHNFESWPPKDHSCHVCFKLTNYWFQRRLLNIFSIGSYMYVKTKLSHGGHLEFPIGKRFTSLVQDHPMIIPAKSQFNWFSGFWREDFQGFNQSEHVIGPGSHVEIPIYTKITNLAEDHSMNISGGWVDGSLKNSSAIFAVFWCFMKF